MAVVIVALAFLLYLVTLSSHYSADSVLFALQIEGGQAGPILDPTHLLLQPSGYAWYQMWRVLGWEVGSLVPLQVANAAGGALAAGILFEIARSLTGSRRIAGLTALGFAVSGGAWLLSVEAEFVTIPLAINLLVLWLILGAPKRIKTWRAYDLLLGAAIALAVLFYASSVILLPVAGAGLLFQDGRSRRNRVRCVAVVTSVVVLICVPVAAGLLLQRSWPEWTRAIWQEGGRGYSALTWMDAPHGIYAFLRSLGLFPGQALNDSGREFLGSATTGQQILFASYYGVLLLVALLPVYLAWPVRRPFWRGFRRELIVVLLWAVLYAGFAIYWVPGDISFWLPVLAAWWIVLALTLAVRDGSQADQGANSRENHRFALSGTVFLAGLFIFLLMINGWFSILPRRDLASNEAYQLALQVRQNTTAADMIVTASDDVAALYLVYFGERTVLPAAETISGNVVSSEAFAELVGDIGSGGGKVYLLRDGDLEYLGP